jgi:nicotinamide riboside kinase
MNIDDNIIKHYLKNVFFITGTAYSGKSTMCKMLADKFGLYHCGENYHLDIVDEIAIPARQPNICYFKTMKDWQEFLNRTPEELEDIKNLEVHIENKRYDFATYKYQF